VRRLGSWSAVLGGLRRALFELWEEVMEKVISELEAQAKLAAMGDCHCGGRMLLTREHFGPIGLGKSKAMTGEYYMARCERTAGFRGFLRRPRHVAMIIGRAA
jgi:hypothetical protein